MNAIFFLCMQLLLLLDSVIPIFLFKKKIHKISHISQPSKTFIVHMDEPGYWNREEKKTYPPILMCTCSVYLHMYVHMYVGTCVLVFLIQFLLLLLLRPHRILHTHCITVGCWPGLSDGLADRHYVSSSAPGGRPLRQWVIVSKTNPTILGWTDTKRHVCPSVSHYVCVCACEWIWLHQLVYIFLRRWCQSIKSECSFPIFKCSCIPTKIK